MPGNHLNRSWEISSAPEGGTATGRVGKGNHTPTIHAGEKSDAPIVCAEQRVVQEG